ncbi:hypothetical protein D5H78_08810 [Vallicoccus soli]|uniref:HD domain-containing protein n=1 Tax=Vallicoccus soli TaxID=2339232 RepID=A0A3A3Z1Q1_9ACTN|nr:hypothetical protein D5H78_08810 [Vallicoccus soli]
MRELNDLKRVRTAGNPRSLAERAFLRSWARLAGGEDVRAVALEETAALVAAGRLGGVDAAVLQRAGLPVSGALGVLRRSFDELAGDLPARDELRAALHGDVRRAPAAPPPGWALALAEQPRAGATRPGHARVVVEPPESHGDHCLVTAAYGCLLAPAVGADRADAFLLGLAHHLHNAVLPDSGFTGEVLLGDALEGVMARLEQEALAELAAGLADRVRRVLAARADAATPLGRAFHAADVLDRVLQVHHHARAAAFTADQALVDLDLVHPGPVQGYQLDVLAAAGLGPGGGEGAA